MPLRSAKDLYGESFLTTQELPDQICGVTKRISVPLLIRLTAVLGCMALATARPSFTAFARLADDQMDGDAQMKHVIEITDDLLKRAKRIAQRDGTTLRELVEDGLRRTLKEREQPVHRDEG